jgi:hypothetical protein
MQTLASFLIGERIRDIQREADAARLARLVSSERTRAPWRRQTGNAVRRLSVALDDLASDLDPSACRPSYGRE